MDANNRIVFATSGMSQKKGKGKGKKVTCYKCKKEGDYVNECDEEEILHTSNKKGSNFFVVKKQKGQMQRCRRGRRRVL